MQSARVIVVPLQITKEMIAAKQKAAKLAKSGDAGKKLTENVDETNEVSGDKGKNPAKQAKKSTVVKKTDVDESWERVNTGSKAPLKTYGKESKKSGSDGIENEPEDMDSEVASHDELPEKNKADKEKRTGEIDKLGNKAGSKTKKEAEEKDEDNEVSKGRKIIKGKTLKKGKDSDDVEDAENLTKEEKSGDDNESEVEKGRTPKKMKKKEEEEGEEGDSESPPKSKAKIKAAKKSTGKTESDGEDNDTGKTEAGDDEDLDLKPARKKRAKKVEEEKEEDAELEDDVKETKKSAGRQRKPKAEMTPAANPPEEQSLSSRRSRRESNLSMKLAEWGLVPVGKWPPRLNFSPFTIICTCFVILELTHSYKWHLFLPSSS